MQSYNLKHETMFSANFLTKNLPVSGLVVSAAAVVFSLAGCSGNITGDLSHLEEFDEYNFPSQGVTINGDVDLYVDYSTCVAEAKYSDYYRATHPSIVDCSPVFWSIKGSRITKETEDPQMVYQLLSNIHEVNNADIKQAVSDIVNKDNQAVLITDGEYFLKNSTRDNLNNPYLADEFRIWLNKGRDIYIFSEPYVESGRHNKFRYYMLFTDAELENNIYDRFSRSAPAGASNVKLLHLNNGVPAVLRAESYPDINPSVSPVADNCRTDGRFDVQEYGVSWKDMRSYLSEGELEQRYVTRGLFVDKSAFDGYRIDEVAPVVYLVAEDYQEFLDSTYLEAPVKPKASHITEVKDVFAIDKAAFGETGELVLVLDEDFDGVGNSLSYEWPNLLKVDFVVTKVSDNFTQNQDLNSAYQWRSISAAQGGAMNTSIFQSISQVLMDPGMNPVGKDSAVLYTLYLSTYSL